MKVLFLTNIPSPYRVTFFNELSKLCELTVIYEKKFSSKRDSKWIAKANNTYNIIFLKGISIRSNVFFSLEIISHLKKNKYDHIIISGISSPTVILAMEYLRLNKIPYMIEADGGIAKDGIGVKERIKGHLIKNAKKVFSTGHLNDIYFTTYGAKSCDIIRYPFSSLTESDILLNPLSKNEKNSIKARLGIKDDKVILTVGQFIHRKGFDILLKAFAMLNNNSALYIVGGKPTSEYKQIISKYNIKNVYFLDFMSKGELMTYYKVADIFVLPTREDIWGLVINEAMSVGLPVITTRGCVAGVELIEDDKNGYIVPVDSIDELYDKINYILDNQALINAMAKNNLEKIKHYTIENMARVHIKFLKSL